MKKIISIAIVLAMVLTMATAAFAAGSGSITINGASEDNIYEIYRIMDLESYNVTSGAYSYKANADWVDFFTTADALQYVAVDAAGYITWIAAEDDDTVAAFAKLALAWAQANSINPIKSTKNVDDYTANTDPETGKRLLKFHDLPLGYYLVDSTMGVLCGLTTTNPNASINAKNNPPTIDKQVQEDSTNQWGNENTADVGQTVYFRVTINVHAGAESYVLHDKMSKGLTFKQVSKIEHIIPSTSGDPSVTVVPATYYTVETEDLEDDCTFEVRFTQEFCDHLQTNDKVVVYYEAMLNRNAVVAGDGNSNEATLEYGEEHFTTADKTETYTYGFDIVKTDSQNTLINGAEFKIYDAATGGNEVAVVLMEDGVTYRRARADETGVSIVVKNGKIRVVGFDNGTYYLEETVAPEGYNKLTSRQKFIIADANLDSVFNSGIYSTGSGVHVVNKTGNMLPETGGMGTVLFITFGALVVLGTGVLLVTKKRMSMIED